MGETIPALEIFRQIPPAISHFVHSPHNIPPMNEGFPKKKARKITRENSGEHRPGRNDS